MWSRHPTELAATLHLANESEQPAVPAQVRDISRGGAKVTVDRQLLPGSMVNLHLPRNDDSEPLTVLACVVRSERLENGCYVLGCVFSRELADDDLSHLGARRVRHDPEDQRVWQRFDCRLRAKIQRVGSPHAAQPTEVQVANLSASGVGLLSGVPIDAGVLLNLELIGKDGGAVRTILACVVHVSRRSDGQWGLGCNFIRELKEEDFQALL
ncbi:MAG: PilZ domain-containing protein [Gemmataceae bacterium]|nr:PilZ domain-containing protein [Gemmataceae bacterium]